MIKEMRRKDRKIFNDGIEEVLINGEYGTLASIGEDGYPYIVPLNYVYYNKSLYFHSAKDGYKLQNIERDAKISFCVVTSTEVLPSEFSTKYKSVIASGVASQVTDDLKDIILLQFVDKYSHDFLDEGKKYIEKAKDRVKVIKINIQHLTGKARR